MSTFQQPCPSCSRLLELPADATGRLAKCPACEATFNIGAPSHAESAELRPQSPQPTSEPAASEPAAPAAPPPPPENPFSSPLESELEDPIPTRRYEGTTYDRQRVAEIGSLQIVPRSSEEILTPTMAIFGARWGLLVFSFVLILIVPWVALIVPVIALNANAGGGFFAGIGILVGIPLMVLLVGGMFVGMARNAIAVARNSPSPMRELLPPLGLVLRFLAGAAVMILVVAVGVLFAALIAGLVSATGNEGLAGFVAGLEMIVGIALSMTAYWLLWAWLFIVSDGRGTGIGSIRMAYTLTIHNKLTSALLVLVAIALFTLGLASCYVGLLVTQPLTHLMFAVAYLLMTNQRIDDPRINAADHKHAPPAEPAN